MKKFRIYLMILACLCLFAGVNVEAKSEKAKALSAYKTFLSKKGISNWDNEAGLKANFKKINFALAYITNDNIPELILHTNENIIGCVGKENVIYTYRAGKVRYLGDFGSKKEPKKAGYYYKKGIVKSRDLDCCLNFWHETYQCFNRSKLTKYYYMSTEYEWRSGKVCSGSFESAGLVKFSGSNPVYIDYSQQEYKIAVQKLTSKISKKFKYFKWYKNTSANRKKYLK